MYKKIVSPSDLSALSLLATHTLHTSRCTRWTRDSSPFHYRKLVSESVLPLPFNLPAIRLGYLLARLAMPSSGRSSPIQPKSHRGQPKVQKPLSHANAAPQLSSPGKPSSSVGLREKDPAEQRAGLLKIHTNALHHWNEQIKMHANHSESCH